MRFFQQLGKTQQNERDLSGTYPILNFKRRLDSVDLITLGMQLGIVNSKLLLLISVALGIGFSVIQLKQFAETTNWIHSCRNGICAAFVASVYVML